MSPKSPQKTKHQVKHPVEPDVPDPEAIVASIAKGKEPVTEIEALLSYLERNLIPDATSRSDVDPDVDVIYPSLAAFRACRTSEFALENHLLERSTKLLRIIAKLQDGLSAAAAVEILCDSQASGKERQKTVLMALQELIDFESDFARSEEVLLSVVGILHTYGQSFHGTDKHVVKEVMKEIELLAENQQLDYFTRSQLVEILELFRSF